MAHKTAILLVLLVALILLARPVSAFGAGNIASIAKVEGHNYRHGDIEDTLKTIAFIKGHKWTSMMVKRVYFGNWLRDYSQAVDVGTLTKVNGGYIRILVWILGFMTFGYATEEFEVTEERLGCYRPEEHIDNPKGYDPAAPSYDKRLRGPVQDEELAIDPRTGMKNYIANETGNWATSAGYVRYSFSRSIHYGRLYTSGPNRGREEDLCEALRCLGQGLHCLEDFGAHTQYVELVLRELGFSNVFAHVGSATEINLRGKRVFPLVTGTFGGVDFLHSVIGEASDHVTQSEVDDINQTLGNASSGSRAMDGAGSGVGDLTGLLSKIPGTGDLSRQAENLQRDADQQAATGGINLSADPEDIIKKIYPILSFRDKVVRAISRIISKIPGLESLVDKITETVTLFVMRLLAPYIMPLVAAASQGLKQGSSTVIHSSSEQQYVVFDDPHSTDPTHSMLSKDHFSNILNEPAGKVAVEILKYAAPRVVYAWEQPDVPVDEVLNDILHTFHHPAIRDMNLEIHRNMFSTVERWVQTLPDRGRSLDRVLSAQSVREGKNHKAEHAPEGGIPNPFGGPGATFGGGKREMSGADQPYAGSFGRTPEISDNSAYFQQGYQGAGGYGNPSYDQPQPDPGSRPAYADQPQYGADQYEPLQYGAAQAPYGQANTFGNTNYTVGYEDPLQNPQAPPANPQFYSDQQGYPSQQGWFTRRDDEY